jgi:hypothetical protein
MSFPEIDIGLELFSLLALIANARFRSKVVIARWPIPQGRQIADME